MYSDFPQAVTFLYTTDLVKAHQFWGQTLGLPTALTQRPPGGDCDVSKIYAISPSAFVGCVLVDPISKPGTGVIADGVVVTLVSSEVDQWAERLQKLGIPLEKGPILNERYNIYHIFFRDPDDHLIEIQEFQDPLWPTVDITSGKESVYMVEKVLLACALSGLIGFALCSLTSQRNINKS